MKELINKIRESTASDATDEARAAGAEACRTLLIALDAKAGESMATPLTPFTEPAVAPVVAGASSQTSPHDAVQAIASALRGMTPDQLLDVAIARLRAALPPGTTVPAPPPLKFHLIPVNRMVSS